MLAHCPEVNMLCSSELCLAVLQAFNESGEPTNAQGIPTNLNAAKWKPIVQFHFINAASDDDFVVSLSAWC